MVQLDKDYLFNLVRIVRNQAKISNRSVSILNHVHSLFYLKISKFNGNLIKSISTMIPLENQVLNENNNKNSLLNNNNTKPTHSAGWRT